MNLKQNINRIHIELQNLADNVSLFEKNDLNYGSYFQIECIKENKKLVAIITKKDLDNDSFNWKYLANPEDSESIVERQSSIHNFVEHVADIYNKNRFDSDYIKNIK
jgi:hypothetical protein